MQRDGECNNVFFSSLQSNWNEIVDNFDDMNLKESLLRGIYAYGFEKPSAIQQRAIIPCIKGMQTVHVLLLISDNKGNIKKKKAYANSFLY